MRIAHDQDNVRKRNEKCETVQTEDKSERLHVKYSGLSFTDNSKSLHFIVLSYEMEILLGILGYLHSYPEAKILIFRWLGITKMLILSLGKLMKSISFSLSFPILDIIFELVIACPRIPRTVFPLDNFFMFRRDTIRISLNKLKHFRVIWPDVPPTTPSKENQSYTSRVNLRTETKHKRSPQC